MTKADLQSLRIDEKRLWLRLMAMAQIGATNAAGMDVFAACSGFLYGITMVESMIAMPEARYFPESSWTVLG